MRNKAYPDSYYFSFSHYHHYTSASSQPANHYYYDDYESTVDVVCRVRKSQSCSKENKSFPWISLFSCISNAHLPMNHDSKLLTKAVSLGFLFQLQTKTYMKIYYFSFHVVCISSIIILWRAWTCIGCMTRITFTPTCLYFFGYPQS